MDLSTSPPPPPTQGSFPYLVQDSPLVGRCLVAARDLEQGELIAEEPPLVQGLSRDSACACLACYDPIDPEDPTCCSRCGLPLCAGPACESSARHAPECHALLQSGQARDRSLALLDDLPLLHESVLLLRCLALRPADPGAWAALTSLESHLAHRRDDEDFQSRVDRLRAAPFLRAALGGDADADLLPHLCGLLDVNSFEVPLTSADADVQAQAVYRVGCLLEHHCVPNTHRSFGGGAGGVDDDPALRLCLRAATAIGRGQHITTTYTDSLWPTAERREHLLASKYFECLCSRCADPTEAGTHLGSLRCAKCPEGTLLPADPLGTGGASSSSYACDACGHALPAEYAAGLNAQVARTVELMETSTTPLTPEQCEKFLLIHSCVLHPQHAHMLDVRHTLLHLLGHSGAGQLMADLDERQLRAKEDAARVLLNVADKLIPGFSRLKGTTLYELYLTYQQRALNWQESNTRSRKDVLATLKSAQECLQECIRQLQFEAKHQAEGKLAERAREEYLMLNNFVESLQGKEENAST